MSGIELRGRLIVFEGLDFCGKSTQVELLAARLRAGGLSVTTTREPGGTPLGESLREIILSSGSAELLPISELLLFVTSRAQLVSEVIEPALARREVVVSSRYRLSSAVYQGCGRGIDLALVERLNDAATRARRADVTFLIDIPAAVALERKGLSLDAERQRQPLLWEYLKDGGQQNGTFAISSPSRDSVGTTGLTVAGLQHQDDRIEQESLAFYERVRRGYLELTRDDPHVHRIDGTLAVSEIAAEVAAYLCL